MKPSDFPRDAKFRDPETKPFRDGDGLLHLFSYADVMRALVNHDQVFTREPAAWLARDHPLHMTAHFMWMVEPFTLDGEPGRHSALRRAVEPWFKARAVVDAEPVVRDFTVRAINDIVDKGTGEVDVATELSSRLSMRVICWLTGIEIEREGWMRQKLDELNDATWNNVPPQWDVQSYLWQLIAKRSSRPKNELLDILISAWKEQQISDDELTGYIYGFIAAGTDTTGASLANALTLLAEFDLLAYAQEAIRDDASLEKILEEVLRFGTPFPMKPLYARKDADFGSVRISAGDVVAVWFAAANRDEAVNGGVPQSDPREFDPARSPNKHLALGWGKHGCLGGDLAKLETRILLQEALERLPALRMVSDGFRRRGGRVDSVVEARFVFDQEQAVLIRHAGVTQASSAREVA